MEMYNKIFKEKYLEAAQNEEYRRIATILFNHSAEYEHEIGKELSDFSLSEIEELLKKWDISAVNSVRTYTVLLKNYINWTIENGSNRLDNPLEGLKNDWYRSMCKTEEVPYLSYSQLVELEDELVNYQDKVIVRMLFEGASGTKLSELVHLKLDDVDKENRTLKLNDEGKYRTIQVSETCIDYILKAHKEETYKTKNGTSNGNRYKTNLKDSEYILKLNDTKKTEKNIADQHLIFRRLSTLEELFSINLKAKNIRNSGMIYYALSNCQHGNEIANSDLDDVAVQFGLRTVKPDGTMIINYPAIKMIKENIKLVYPELF